MTCRQRKLNKDHPCLIGWFLHHLERFCIQEFLIWRGHMERTVVLGCNTISSKVKSYSNKRIGAKLLLRKYIQESFMLLNQCCFDERWRDGFRTSINHNELLPLVMWIMMIAKFAVVKASESAMRVSNFEDTWGLLSKYLVNSLAAVLEDVASQHTRPTW